MAPATAAAVAAVPVAEATPAVGVVVPAAEAASAVEVAAATVPVVAVVSEAVAIPVAAVSMEAAAASLPLVCMRQTVKQPHEIFVSWGFFLLEGTPNSYKVYSTLLCISLCCSMLASLAYLTPVPFPFREGVP